jgi:glycosyltransferase involved in cell wall biosynthesis
MRTLVFLPAWNEQDAVGATIAEIKRELPAVDVLVCDDGSDDRTAAAARAAGAIVASFPFHVGIGAAVHAGYLYAARYGYDYCAHLDADGQHPANELKKLLELVWAGDCDLAIGSRYLGVAGHAAVEDRQQAEVYSASLSRKIGIALFRRLLTWQTGYRFTDTTSGFRAANRTTIEFFAYRYASDYPELESLQLAVSHGLRVQEAAVWVRPRAAGRSKITPLRSAHFVWKSLFTVIVGLLPTHRPSGHPEGRKP